VSYASHVSPPSLVARSSSGRGNPGVLPPRVATHVPLAANPASPGRAGGMLALMSSQTMPSVMRRLGNTPFTESLKRDAAVRRPEREAVVERQRVLVLELHRPCRAAVDRLVDAEVLGVGADGLQVRDLGAHALHVAELEQFSARHHAGLPGLAAVGRDDEGAKASGRPDDLRFTGLTAISPAVVPLSCGVRVGTTFDCPCAATVARRRAGTHPGNVSAWHFLPWGQREYVSPYRQCQMLDS